MNNGKGLLSGADPGFPKRAHQCEGVLQPRGEVVGGGRPPPIFSKSK